MRGMVKRGTVLVDCAAGQRMGCELLCCRLFVPLSLEEMAAGLQTQSPLSNLLRQEPDGFCCYLDRATRRCTIWQRRPLVCRRYNCNDDPKLQVVLREGFTSFGRLIEQSKLIPRDRWQSIPLLSRSPAGEVKRGRRRASGRRTKKTPAE
ncbi:MAG: YkgJ family cysteine cluster protein [Deltaproteobacteria bacterium]|nr:YkgJ family cysteine cluster protein [Deltaproteobacteria bacterium]